MVSPAIHDFTSPSMAGFDLPTRNVSDEIDELLRTGEVSFPASFSSTVLRGATGQVTLICRQHLESSDFAQLKETIVYGEQQRGDRIHTLNLQLPIRSGLSMGLCGDAVVLDARDRNALFESRQFMLELRPEVDQQQGEISRLADGLLASFTANGHAGVGDYLANCLPDTVGHSRTSRAYQIPKIQPLHNENQLMVDFSEKLIAYCGLACERWSIDARKYITSQYAVVPGGDAASLTLTCMFLGRPGSLSLSIDLERHPESTQEYKVSGLSLCDSGVFYLPERYCAASVHPLNPDGAINIQAPFWRNLADALIVSAARHGKDQLVNSPIFDSLSPFNPVPVSILARSKALWRTFFPSY